MSTPNPVVYVRNPTTGVWSVVVPSSDGTTVTATSKTPITDAAGNAWTIGASGVVAVNGASDYSTYGVTELAYVNGFIWQFNGTDWFGKAISTWSTPTTESPFSAIISWIAPTTNIDGTPITGLTDYIVSYGSSPTALTHTATVTSTSFSVTALTSGTWYFAVAAVNKYGVKSANSTTVFKVI
jgi:hypothetical protein